MLVTYAEQMRDGAARGRVLAAFGQNMTEYEQ
jgi:hypothetical protein